jgi:hypothetical protein
MSFVFSAPHVPGFKRKMDAILKSLGEVEAEYDVRILLATEVGASSYNSHSVQGRI